MAAADGGAATAARYPLLMSSTEGGAALWDKVPVLADDTTGAAAAAAGLSAAGRTAPAAAAGSDDKKAKQSRPGGKEKEKDGSSTSDGSSAKKDSARVRSAGSSGAAAGSGAAAAASPAAALSVYDASLAAHRVVELTFDAKRIVDLSAGTPSASAVGAKSKKASAAAAAAAAAEAAPALFLVEMVQIGAALSATTPLLTQLQQSGLEGGRGGDKETGGAGSYSISLLPAAESDSAAAAVISSSSVLSGDASLSLFSVNRPSGSLRPGVRESVRFLFDWSRYLSVRSQDPERRVLKGVGQWVEARAMVQIRGGVTPSHLHNQQIIEIKLRVYVE